MQPRYRDVGLRSYEDGQHLLRWSAFGQTWELYDLKRDPDQRINVFEERPGPAHALEPGLTAPMRTAIGPAPDVELDPRAQEALRVLGYVE